MELNGEDWMAALPEELWDIPLTHLAIPGIFDLFLKRFSTHIASEALENRKQRIVCSVGQICGPIAV